MKESNAIFLGVLGHHIDEIKLFDTRFESPYISIENGSQEVVFQRIDKIVLNDCIRSYLSINHVSININTLNNSINRAQSMYELLLANTKSESDFHDDVYNRDALVERSKIICDYVEAIQEAIVFSYTSLESFVNMSIPNDYVYIKRAKHGVEEHFNCEGIQKYLPLKEKLKNIMCDIYKIENLTQEPFWQDYCKLEELRNSIIHLKKDETKSLISELLKRKTFETANSSTAVIEHFIETCVNRDSVLGNQHLWPHLSSKKPIYSTRNAVSLQR